MSRKKQLDDEKSCYHDRVLEGVGTIVSCNIILQLENISKSQEADSSTSHDILVVWQNPNCRAKVLIIFFSFWNVQSTHYQHLI
jgi:hypothetical protein